MNTEFIEFKKQRDLGEILSDTFAFLRNQFSPFFNTYLKIVGPYILVMLVSLGIYTYFGGDMLSGLSSNNFNGEMSNLVVLMFAAIAYLISIIAVYTMSQSTALFYIKSYDENKGQIDYETIRSNVYENFWSFIGLGIIVGISVLFGFMFCLIPGIYLYVPLCLTFSILVFKKMGASDAYSYSFKLVKDEWWMTFATLFVIGIIVTVATYAFAIPGIAYTYLKMGVFSGEIDPENIGTVSQDPIYLIFNLIASLAQFLLNLISVIAAAFIYFNLNEKKNHTGTFEKIQSLGQNPEN